MKNIYEREDLFDYNLKNHSFIEQLRVRLSCEIHGHYESLSLIDARVTEIVSSTGEIFELSDLTADDFLGIGEWLNDELPSVIEFNQEEWLRVKMSCDEEEIADARVDYLRGK